MIYLFLISKIKSEKIISVKRRETMNNSNKYLLFFHIYKRHRGRQITKKNN